MDSGGGSKATSDDDANDDNGSGASGCGVDDSNDDSGNNENQVFFLEYTISLLFFSNIHHVVI